MMAMPIAEIYALFLAGLLAVRGALACRPIQRSGLAGPRSDVDMRWSPAQVFKG
jgi:hypothetical protein